METLGDGSPSRMVPTASTSATSSTSRRVAFWTAVSVTVNVSGYSSTPSPASGSGAGAAPPQVFTGSGRLVTVSMPLSSLGNCSTLSSDS